MLDSEMCSRVLLDTTIAIDLLGMHGILKGKYRNYSNEANVMKDILLLVAVL